MIFHSYVSLPEGTSTPLNLKYLEIVLPGLWFNSFGDWNRVRFWCRGDGESVVSFKYDMFQCSNSCSVSIKGYQKYVRNEFERSFHPKATILNPDDCWKVLSPPDIERLLVTFSLLVVLICVWSSEWVFNGSLFLTCHGASMSKLNETSQNCKAFLGFSIFFRQFQRVIYGWLEPYCKSLWSDLSHLKCLEACSPPKTNVYGSIPIDTFLVGWTSIYQLFWGSLGTRVLTHPQMKRQDAPQALLRQNLASYWTAATNIWTIRMLLGSTPGHPESGPLCFDQMNGFHSQMVKVPGIKWPENHLRIGMSWTTVSRMIRNRVSFWSTTVARASSDVGWCHDHEAPRATYMVSRVAQPDNKHPQNGNQKIGQWWPFINVYQLNYH